MSDNTTTENGSKGTRSPSHIAYQVREGNKDQSFWDRIGVAWANKDGGFTVQLHAVPLSGKIVLQVPKKK